MKINNKIKLKRTRKISKKKARKSRKLRQLKGGNNIGYNCFNPNYSIYNTNLLKLFPYKA